MTPLRKALEVELKQQADPERASQQQAYMKSDMPYAGLTAPQLKATYAQLFKLYPCENSDQWQSTVADLWHTASVRESRYVAISLLLLPKYRKQWLTPEVLPLVQMLIETGAWWDYVDNLASNGVGHILANYTEQMTPVMRKWAVNENLWVRRSAILSQLKFKSATDQALLFECIMGSVNDNDFFARKAIGWALRQYSRTAPDAVIAFVDKHAQALSKLSKREALRILVKQGYIQS